MASLHSRRKQSKPQRLDEEPKNCEELADADEGPMISEAMDIGFHLANGQNDAVIPMDLSKKRVSGIDEEKPVLEDRSNLFLQLGIAPHQILSLYAQLSGRTATETPQESEGPTVDECSPPGSSSPESRQADVTGLACPAEGCSETYPSRASLLWHVEEAHAGEKLMECGECGERVRTAQMRSHRCVDPPTRPATADPTNEPSDVLQRRSASPRMISNFSMLTPSCSRSSDLPQVPGFFSQLFPKSSEAPMDLTASTSSCLPTSLHQPHLFPPFSGFPHSPFPTGLPPGMPHFLLRPPFPGPPGSGPPDGLFPRDVLANEDDWESLMEVSNTDEAEKIRALVGDKPLPTTDPNQCILCRRVLSCKSALQMHYRTHTGERPFKCKICQRAFTTKGNLKTHMGVHRSKHAFRGVGMGPPMLSPAQQCPICQKRFLSGQQLQIHIAEHTQKLSNNPLMHGDRPKLPQMPQGLPPGFPMFPFPFPAGFPQPPMMQQTPRTPPPSTVPRSPAAVQTTPTPFSLAAMLGLGPVEKKESREEPPVLEKVEASTHAPAAPVTTTDNNHYLNAFAERLGFKMDTDPLKELKTEAPKPAESVSPAGSSSEGSAHEQTDGSSVGRGGESEADEKRQCGDEESPEKAETDQPFDGPRLDPEDRKRPTENPLEAMQKMWAEANTEPPPPRQMPVLSKHQCGVCFKHFSSSSALQIHMRTHTGDKPFKCEVCARAFTTRGNLKVHMGTHMWQQSPSRRGRRIFDANGGPETSPRPSLNGPGGPMVGPFPFPFPGPSPAGASIDVMMMLMRTVCSVCQKVCATPAELEQHLKGHLSALAPPGNEGSTATAS